MCCLCVFHSPVHVLPVCAPQPFVEEIQVREKRRRRRVAEERRQAQADVAAARAAAAGARTQGLSAEVCGGVCQQRRVCVCVCRGSLVLLCIGVVPRGGL